MYRKFVLVVLVMLVAVALSVAAWSVTPAKDSDNHYRIVWVRYADKSLWTVDYPLVSAPKKLYGHEVDLRSLVSSRDGSMVATRYQLFDTRLPGTRRTLPRYDINEEKELMLGELTPDGKALLVSRVQMWLGFGVYAAYLDDGRRELVAKPVIKDAATAELARYSPDGRRLALEGMDWLQIVEVSGGKTLLEGWFDDDIDQGFDCAFGEPRDWLDNERFVFARPDGLWFANLGNMKVEPLIPGLPVRSFKYATQSNRIYLVPDSNEGSPHICVIDPSTGKMENLSLPIKGWPGYIYGISPDGNLLLLSILSSDPGGESLWIVDLTAGKGDLIAHGTARAVLLY